MYSFNIYWFLLTECFCRVSCVLFIVLPLRRDINVLALFWQETRFLGYFFSAMMLSWIAFFIRSFGATHILGYNLFLRIIKAFCGRKWFCVFNCSILSSVIGRNWVEQKENIHTYVHIFVFIVCANKKISCQGIKRIQWYQVIFLLDQLYKSFTMRSKSKARRFAQGECFFSCKNVIPSGLILKSIGFDKSY